MPTLLVAATLLMYALVTGGRAFDVVVPRGDFLALHALIEVISAVVCITVGVTSWQVVDQRRRHAGRALGSAFIAVGLIDMLHLLSYAGMPDLGSPSSTHKAILLWLLARLVPAVALLAWSCPCPAWLARRPGVSRGVLAASSVVLAGAAAAALFVPERFPAMFVPGVGLTPLKVGLELSLIGLYLLALLAMQRRLARANPDDRADEAPVLMALLLMALSEGFFVAYSDSVTDMANLLGHAYKVAAYAYLFRGLFLNQIRRPFLRLARAHAALERRSGEYRELIELAPEGVVLADEKGRMQVVNRALEEMFGYRRDQLLGQPLTMLIPPARREHHREAWRSYATSPPGQRITLADGTRGLRADGREIDLEVAFSLTDTAAGRRTTAYVADVSYRQQHQRALEHRSTHDPLTGLPNRWLLGDRLAEAAEAARQQGSLVGLLLLDIEHFHLINETHGTQAGDALLREVAERLANGLRADDTVARLGGDEFAVLVTGLDDASQARLVARKLQATLAPGMLIGSSTWPLAVSIGLAVFPRDGESAGQVLQCAELALHEAKRRGRAQITAYDAELGEQLKREVQIRTRLRLAIEEDRLALHYQPQVDIASGRVSGFEALLRWHDEELGHVSPAAFVPVAERAGLVQAMGQRVLQAACRQLRAWRDAGVVTRVAINLSPLQFRQPGLARQIAHELRRQQLPADTLAVEITESAVMDDPSAAAEQLRSLTALGIEVHLDDFGTGHSSLAWLKAFPISTIKIDRGFVHDMMSDGSDDAIVRAVIGLAHTLDCTVVAEGVEHPAQLERLRTLGCEVYQGWLFSKALPPDEALAMLTRAGAAPARPTTGVVAA
ncbi:bifunctional diguanylate cyclase/phosphodiesterase [Ideonella sp.]|uniref:bifunctional diguanylate cyclase/phosphodiesterase n=1 Tax=Ideonella sp. TaxID=1929293 RepID=UPI002B493D42|nr:EAL domain-containing protein [Ideonella sp.]HJV67576.1 EAL domain-containing protein [Ideonella sp.]